MSCTTWDTECTGKIGEELRRCLAEHRKGNDMEFKRSGFTIDELARRLVKLAEPPRGEGHGARAGVLDDTPEPDADDENLAELIQPHLNRYAPAQRGPVEKGVRGHYKALRARGLNHKMASAAVVGMLSADRPVSSLRPDATVPIKTRGQGSGSASTLSDPSGVPGVDLPTEVQAMIDRLNSRRGGYGDALGPGFVSAYARLRRIMDDAQARKQAAAESANEEERLMGLLSVPERTGAKDQNLILTDTETAYWNASERLAAEVAKVQAVDPTKPYDRILAAVTRQHPQLAETIRVSPVQREASDAAFKDRDTVTSKIEALMLSEKLTWRQAYDRILAADRSLVERAVAER
jgi:hypothetical protein